MTNIGGRGCRWCRGAGVPGGGGDGLLVLDGGVFDDDPVRERSARRVVEADAFDGVFRELGLVVDGGVAFEDVVGEELPLLQGQLGEDGGAMARAPWRPRVEWSMAGVALTWRSRRSSPAPPRSTSS